MFLYIPEDFMTTAATGCEPVTLAWLNGTRGTKKLKLLQRKEP